jgi:uncharacterized membrane protein YbjE (DUF340 family)
MKNTGFKLTLLVFLVALMSGFYLNLSLIDNLIRSFVIYVVFSVVYLAISLVISQVSLDVLKQKQKLKSDQKQEKLNHATPNIAK